MRRVGLAFSFLALAGCGGDDGGNTADRLVINVIDAAALPDMGPPADASLFMEECNTTTQNCQNPATPKCTFIVSGGALETECASDGGRYHEFSCLWAPKTPVV